MPPHANAARPPAVYVYVCHPFSDDVDGEDQVQMICRAIQKNLPMLPVVPSRGLAPQRRLQLLESCNELRIYGHTFTDDMVEEIEHAETCRIPIYLLMSEAA